jgi:hypothetical protein
MMAMLEPVIDWTGTGTGTPKEVWIALQTDHVNLAEQEHRRVLVDTINSLIFRSRS